MDQFFRQPVASVDPSRLFRAGLVFLLATLLLYAAAVGATRLGWMDGDPVDILRFGAVMCATVGFLAGWVYWGDCRRRRSDGAIFGRHSRIGTTAANDYFVGCLLVGAVALAVAPFRLLPVAFSVTMLWILQAGLNCGIRSSRDLAMSLGRSFLAILGLAPFSVVQRITWLDLSHFWHASGMPAFLASGMAGFLASLLFVAIVLPAYAANLHADAALGGAQRVPDDLP